MRTLWRHLRPHAALMALTLLLAGLAQVLALVDPLIFGRIVDRYVLNPGLQPEADLVRRALGWLLVAAAVAFAARLVGALQEYALRLLTQKVGREMFDDGLRHTLRLPFQDMGDRSSGETMALLQKVRTDTERFINATVNTLYASLVGIGFLVWFGVTRHWLLIPVFGIGVLVLGGLTGLLSRKIKSTQRAIVRETARMSGAITESLRNIELVKSLGLTRQEILRLRGPIGLRQVDARQAPGRALHPDGGRHLDRRRPRLRAALQPHPPADRLRHPGHAALLGIDPRKSPVRAAGRHRRGDADGPARALLRRPRLFIFDEATSALDSITEREVTSSVREVSGSRQHMVILIAHRLSTVAHADTIYVLERGRVVETGSHDTLVEARGLYYAMWRQQIGEREPEALGAR